MDIIYCVGAGLASYGVDDEINDCVGEQGDNEADNGIEDGIFSVGNLFSVATRDDVAEAAVN